MVVDESHVQGTTPTVLLGTYCCETTRHSLDAQSADSITNTDNNPFKVCVCIYETTELCLCNNRAIAKIQLDERPVCDDHCDLPRFIKAYLLDGAGQCANSTHDALTKGPASTARCASPATRGKLLGEVESKGRAVVRLGIGHSETRRIARKVAETEALPVLVSSGNHGGDSLVGEVESQQSLCIEV